MFENEIPNDVVIAEIGIVLVRSASRTRPLLTPPELRKRMRLSRVRLCNGWRAGRVLEACRSLESDAPRPGASNVSLTLRSYLSSAGVSSPP